ncbi:hypothetical protein X797_005909 [Metarhizium robertsii]|uniref:DUF6594 domain-containing protein n=2 Tax=Metarhizium robertsii TaxID=568076 RepID=E9EN61_METRA|nr:uncharacterized protein MAA_01199 [Metarhizium robertsii ARSEF 23]EFZ04125.1 hypothetical protein MAA_01199 [Metarhizium robertsii ARSEF 23]EXV00896.1 hypothetical protein X797_005909 [Metarhizium robertsii]
MVVSEKDPEKGKAESATGSSKKMNLLPGFPATSDFISRDPSKTTVICRRFDKLALRNLLYLEARLAALGDLQEKFDHDDKDVGNEPVRTAARSWEDFAVFGTYQETGETPAHNPLLPQAALRYWTKRRLDLVHLYRQELMPTEKVQHESQTGHIGGEEIHPGPKGKWPEPPSTGAPAPWSTFHSLRNNVVIPAEESNIYLKNDVGCGRQTLELIKSRWELALAIEECLKIYQEAVLRYREMLKLEPPANRTKAVVSDWIAGVVPDQRPRRAQTDGETVPHTQVPRKEPASDLVAVGRIAGADLLTKWVATWNWLFVFKDKNFPYQEIERVPEHVIDNVVTILVVILAVVLVIGGIWGLYYLRIKQGSFAADLGLLSGLIVLFAVAVKFMTMASRTDLFLATAAYTTVMVVFVSFQAPHGQDFKFLFGGGSGNGTISG